MKQEQFNVEFKELAMALLRRWYIVMFVILVTTIAGTYLKGEEVRTYYETSTRIIIGNAIDEQGKSYNIQDLQVYQNYMNTYIAMLKTDTILDGVVEKMSFPVSVAAIANNLSAAPKADTQFLDVKLTWPVKEEAAEVLEVVTETFVEEMHVIYPAINLHMMDKIKEPVMRTVGRPKTYTMRMSAIVGSILAVLVVFGIEFLDNTIKDEGDIQYALSSYLLTIIPRQGRKGKKIDFSNNKMPNGYFMEAYRRLRTNLDFLSISARIKAVAITSARPNEGKSTTAAMLAMCMAMSGKKTLLIDCDFRNSTLEDIFHLKEKKGIVDVLLCRIPIEEAIIASKITGLHILQVGVRPINASEILSSDKMKALMKEIKNEYEYIVIDTPPVGVVADAQIISQYVDGTILVATHRKTKIKEMAKAKALIEQVGGDVLGIVINKKRMFVKNKGYYGYYVTKKGKKKNKKAISITNSPIVNEKDKAYGNG